jgi:hypothetical protein
VSGHKPSFCLDVVIFLVSPFSSFRPLMKALLPLVKVGLFFARKVQVVDSDQLLFMGVIWGPTKGSLGWPWVKLERLHGQAPLFLSFRFHLVVRPRSCQVVDRLGRSASCLRQVERTFGYSGFGGSSNSPDGSSQSVLFFLPRQGGEFCGGAP